MKENKHDEYCGKDLTSKCDCYVENDMSDYIKRNRDINKALKAPETRTFPNEVLCINDEVDVLNYVTKSSTKAQRIKFNIGDIYINAVVCHVCGSYVRSKNLRDFKPCECGNVAIDGGSWYQKLNYKNDYYTLITEYFYDK